VTAYRSSWHLFGYAVGDLYVIRAPTVVLSVLATPAVMGSFGAVVTAYQAIGGVIQNALQVPMAARARDRLGIEHSKHPAGFSIAVGLVGAIPGAALVVWLAPWLTGRLLKLPDPDAATWLTVFMIGLPFLAVTRALMFNWIGDAHYGRATRAVFVLAAVQAVTVAIAVPWLGALGAAAATAAAEIIALGLILAFFIRRR
jgi:O-antigen/teichoic acid export membrane protein